MKRHRTLGVGIIMGMAVFFLFSVGPGSAEAAAGEVQQEISLKQGWNLISFQVNKCYYTKLPSVFIPAGAAMEKIDSLADWLSDNLDSPLRDAADLNKAGDWQIITSFDSNGAHILDKNIPDFINSLKYLSVGYGYWIKMNKPGKLILEGQWVSTNVSLALHGGWNLIGFIPHDTCYGNVDESSVCPFSSGYYQPAENILYCRVDPVMLDITLDLVADDYSRVTTFDSCKGALIYDMDVPSFINSLHYVGPKYGYWVKVENPDGVLLIFPDNCSEMQL